MALAIAAPSAAAAPSQRLYWANAKTSPQASGTTVKRCGLGSLPCSPQTVAEDQGNPFGVAVNSSHVYWTNSGDNTVMRCSISASLPCTGQVVASGETSEPVGMALSATHIYWAVNTPGTIRRCPIAGPFPCSPETVASAPDASQPAVDGTHVYWTQFDGDAIRRCPLNASFPCTPETVADSEDHPVGIALTATHVYWGNTGLSSSLGGSIRRCPIAGPFPCTPETVASDELGVRGVAVDSDHLYWSNAQSGSAFRCPIDGPFPCDSPTEVVSGENGISQIALQPAAQSPGGGGGGGGGGGSENPLQRGRARTRSAARAETTGCADRRSEIASGPSAATTR